MALLARVTRGVYERTITYGTFRLNLTHLIAVPVTAATMIVTEKKA
jgi:hypothetical protein